MSALYRKYRPQTFADLIGQNHIKITLEHELERGEIGHAYLFCGPRGLGKTTTARLFAKAVNCENRKDGESEPCNKCASCLDIMAGRNVDMIEIDAASHTGVDNVRENIIENSRFTPNRSKYKVFIIDEVHMLTTSAFNALLKTLEEPPAHVIFILCTTEIHKLPQTIISRCQRFDFRRVSSEDMLKRLRFIIKEEKKKVEEIVLKNITLNADGCLRDAESLLGKILTLGDDISAEQAEIVLPRSDFNSIVSFLNFLNEKNSNGAIELVNRLVEEGVDLQIFTDNLIEFLRKIMLIKVNGNLSDFGIELDEENQKAAERLAERFDYARIVSLIEIFLAKRQELKTAFISQFPLEMAVVEICEEVICEQKDDFDPPASASSELRRGEPVSTKFQRGEPVSGGSSESVREKIKDKLAQLSPRKNKDEEKVALTPAKEIKADDELKVDMLSRTDKLKPSAFVDFEKIKENWPLVLEKLLEKNYTLAALLKISQPLKIRDNVLEIGVKSNFYRDRLADTKNRLIVEETLSSIMLTNVLVKGVVKEDIEPIEAELKPTEKSAETKEAPISAPLAKPKDVVQDVMSMF